MAAAFGGEVYLRQVARPAGRDPAGAAAGRREGDPQLERHDGLTPDGVPIIGPSRAAPGLLHGFGFPGHGFMLLPAVGVVLVGLALDGRTDVPREPFRPDRFGPAPGRP